MKSNYSGKGKSKYNNKTSNNHSIIHLIPLIFIITFLPLIMHFYTYNPKLSQYPWFSNLTQYTDSFLFYKQLFFIITCLIMLLVIVYYLVKSKGRIQLPVILYPIIIYGILTFLSTLFSKYSSYGFSGGFEQFESVFVLMGYVITVVYCYIYIKGEQDLRTLNYFLIIGTSLLGILGLSQAFGVDLLRTDFFKKLYIPQADWGNLDSITFNFPLKTAFLTLYNPNYVGVYTALVIPILVVLLSAEKSLKLRIMLVFSILSMIITLISSGSAAGLFSITITAFLAVIIFRKTIFRNKVTISVFFVFAVVLLSLFLIKFDTIKSLAVNKLSLVKTVKNINDIKTDKNLEITYKGNTMLMNYDNNNSQINISLKDTSNNLIPFQGNGTSGEQIINDSRFQGITITPVLYENTLCMKFVIDGKDWVFTNQTGDGTFYYLNSKGKFDKMKTAASAIFTGYEKLITGRGYIWSRTIPLLKNNIILGKGADSFVFQFPQNDYLNYYYSGFEGEVLTKPHSLYLQVGTQTGLLSLIAMLSFMLLYIISSLRVYFKSSFQSYNEKVGAAYFLGVFSYMIVSIANDSSITVAPVFWVLIGTGIVINYKLLVKSQS